MKKLIVFLFSLFLGLGITEVQAQTAMDNSKDEFWGTTKRTRGTSADAVGARSESLDTKYNSYETGKRSNFRLMRYNDKKLTEMQKREAKVLKKHQREKKKLAKKQARHRRNS